MAENRKHSIEGVLFDWDGTLINSYHADTSAYLAMFKEMDISWGIAELEKNYSPNWYQVYHAAGSKLIAGARRVLARLGDAHNLGLVTSGDRDRVTRQLREFRLTKLFAVCVYSGDTMRKKPHPDPLRLALRQMELHPSACVYVGDAPQDVEMAKRAGVRAIGVLGPFPTEKRLRAAHPEFLIGSIEELPDVLKRLLR